ncbi:MULTISPECIES: RICIN domain-containing protein [Acidobacteriaceae]|uniref:RICIN domain-containing protein n=1 Tax=Acidobacteriaceae TaxID=204434 RepID=UPI00131AFF40|nr:MULTISPECIES: RICIN domain-containing protein [Acidobacteriaceae]MDW5267429.1 RICIN domain-containing protein [Edaphobacter sp.]
MRLFHYTVGTKFLSGLTKAATVLLVIATIQLQAHAAATYMLAYPAAPYDGASGTYTLKADSTTIPVTAYYGGRYSFGHLAFEGTTTFVLSTRNGAAITSYNISPHDFGITGSVSGSHLTLSVTQGQSTYLIINVSTASGALEPMVIAGDPQETNIPTIGGNVYDITAPPYNADKTGDTLLNTTIQNAIDTVSSSGGGTIYFPAGVYEISNNIQMKSNVTMYLAAGAFIHGSSNRNDYTWNTSGTLQNGQPEQGPQNFVITGAVNNVAFTGRGVIDANSTVLVTPSSTGGSINGFGNYRKGIIQSGADSNGNRPNGLKIIGITVKDATTWTFDIGDEQNVTIQNVKMLDDFKWVHSDGYDIVSTNNATIDNCLGVTGDDTFDAKAGDTNPVSNVTYSNDVGYSWEGDGTKVGVQAKGTASNIVFSNIQVVAGQRAVSVSHDEGTAGYSGIHFNDIHMENLEGSSSSGEFLVAPIVIWTLGGGDGPVDNVSLSRVTVDDSRGFASKIQGTNSAGTVSNVTLQDVSIDGTTITSSNYSSKIDVGTNVSGLNFGLVSGGIYSFASQHNDLAMDNGNVTTCDNPVIQWPINLPETSSQKWQLTSVGTNIYTIVSQKSGCALDNSSSNLSPFGLLQSTLNGQIQQKWTITNLGNDYYKVISTQSGEALDDDNVPPNTESTNTQVVQFTPNGNSTQQWKLTMQ